MRSNPQVLIKIGPVTNGILAAQTTVWNNETRWHSRPVLRDSEEGKTKHLPPSHSPRSIQVLYVSKQCRPPWRSIERSTVLDGDYQVPLIWTDRHVKCVNTITGRFYRCFHFVIGHWISVLHLRCSAVTDGGFQISNTKRLNTVEHSRWEKDSEERLLCK